MIYHFMFGPPYEAGCTVCSSIADNFNANAPHLNGRRRDRAARLARPARQAPGLQGADGLGQPRLGLNGGDDFNRDLGFLHTEEELKPFLESGEIPVTVEKMAERSGTDVKGYVTEGPGMSVYALVRRDGLPDLRDDRARGSRDPRWRTTPFSTGPREGRHEGADEPIWIRRHDEYEAA